MGELLEKMEKQYWHTYTQERWKNKGWKTLEKLLYLMNFMNYIVKF